MLNLKGAPSAIFTDGSFMVTQCPAAVQVQYLMSQLVTTDTKNKNESDSDQARGHWQAAGTLTSLSIP